MDGNQWVLITIACYRVRANGAKNKAAYILTAVGTVAVHCRLPFALHPDVYQEDMKHAPKK